MKKKPGGYWTKEKCHEEALKYKTKTEFKNNSRSAYNFSYRHNLLNEMCSHMILNLRVKKNHWTKEKCHNEALKYNSRTNFKINKSGAYKKAYLNNWLNEICSHMMSDRKPNGYWTKENIHKTAMKYNFKTDFMNNETSAYSKALQNKWIDEICEHMISSKNDSLRCIYAHEFSDNHVYVGLTNNFKRRKTRHHNIEKNSSVYKHIKKTKLIPKVIQLTDYIQVEKAKQQENFYVKLYELLKWKILNQTKTGSIGSNIIKWTKEKCHKEALKYNSRSEFQIKSLAYNPALRNKWLDDICEHMLLKHKHNGYWTKEKCLGEALKFESRFEFQKNSHSAYKKALVNKWLDDICEHMIFIRKPNHNFKSCHEEALKYNRRVDFLKKSHGAYERARQEKWLDEICSHMISNIQQ